MNFDEVLKKRLQKTSTILGTKAKEYSTTDNRFHNFDVAAKIDGETPEQALWGMLKKHLVSIIDLKDAPENATECLVNEKIGDAINYLILLEGLLTRRIENEKEATK